MIKPIERIQGRAIPLDRADVDTDQIIPARHLKSVDRTGFGKFAFELWRGDPDFVLNDERYNGAPILIAGPNFGCGSSREHAPWALDDMGLRVIIAPSFADIFRNNCVNVGLLTVELSPSECSRFMARVKERPERELIVDLPAQTISFENGEARVGFQIDSFIKHCLINGLDAIALTLERVDQIADFEAERPSFLPCTITDDKRM